MAWNPYGWGYGGIGYTAAKPVAKAAASAIKNPKTYASQGESGAPSSAPPGAAGAAASSIGSVAGREATGNVAGGILGFMLGGPVGGLLGSAIGGRVGRGRDPSASNFFGVPTISSALTGGYNPFSGGPNPGYMGGFDPSGLMGGMTPSNAPPPAYESWSDPNESSDYGGGGFDATDPGGFGGMGDDNAGAGKSGGGATW